MRKHTVSFLVFLLSTSVWSRDLEAPALSADKLPQSARNEWRTLSVPTSLTVRSSPRYGVLAVFDDTSFVDVLLERDPEVSVWVEYEFFYFERDTRVVLYRELGIHPNFLKSPMGYRLRGAEAAAEVQGNLQIVAELGIFESDLGSHQMGPPEKYRRLWTGYATGVFRAITPLNWPLLQTAPGSGELK